MPRATFVSDRTTRRQEKRDRVFQQHQSQRSKRNGPPPRRRSAPSVRPPPPPPPPTPLPPSPPPPTPPTSAGGGDDQELSVLCDDEDEPPPPRPRFKTVEGNSLISFVSPSQALAVHNLGALGLGLKRLPDGSVGGETDNDRTEFLSSEIKGKDMATKIGSGRQKLASVPSCGAAAAEQKKEVKRKSVIRITTGSHGLEELFGGGFETFAIKKAFGGLRSGKAQLAHTCVSTQLPTHMHGVNGKVAYLDTEGTVLPERLVLIAERFGLDPGAIFDNIVDSLIALFRIDFTGRGELADRQQKIAQMLSRLVKIAEEFNVAVYMANQVIADPCGGGHVLADAATITLFRKGKGEQRVCKITAGGIADAKN